MPLGRTIVQAALLALTLTLAACAGGPLGRDVIAAARPGGRVSFDVVDLTPAVLATLRAHQPPPFDRRFAPYQPPPRLPIAVGDGVTVVIWEAADDGLFGSSLAQLSLPAGSAAQLKTGQVTKPAGTAPLPGGLTPAPTQLASLYGFATPGGQALAPSAGGAGGFASPQLQQLLAVAAESDVPGTAIPEQQVGIDGGITIPYAGRVAVAGKTPKEAAALIEKRLAPLAIEPQALVVVTHSAANSVAVTGSAVSGRRIALPGSGARLTQVIAAAGGARAPVRDTYVELTRGGVTAGVPLATLIADPAQDIYVRPGDAVTVERRPQTFTVLGATGRNAAITFTRDRLSLAEALGAAGGLRDERADARAVFVFRYEPDALVRALGEPIASDARDGVSPIAYRIDLQKPGSLLLARRFPVHDKDVIFVANAPTQPLYYFFQALQQVTGPVVTGFVACRSSGC